METTQSFLSPERGQSNLRFFICWELIMKGAKNTSCIGGDGLPEGKD